MMRHKDWSHRLGLWLAGISRMPFDPGTHDCALFAAGAVEAMTGTDLAAGWRGRYRTLRGGIRVLRRAGHADHIALARAYFPVTVKPDPGDLAVVPTPEGPALGVVQGALIYVPAAVGYGLVPIGTGIEFLKV